ncbi:MAG: hypothetical protein QOD70_2559 [Frankiales bacterium]|nr:hypothetical protein [Frankiales bacterium]
MVGAHLRQRSVPLGYGRGVVDRRKIIGGVAVVLVLAGVGTFLGLRAAQPPRPSLPYPAGQSLGHVRSNCSSGNELVGCDSQTGPRSFVEVTARGDVRDASDTLFATLKANGWKEDDNGLVASDYSAGGQAEDIQPVFCRTGKGCVGLFRYEAAGFVLAWWQAAPGDGG